MSTEKKNFFKETQKKKILRNKEIRCKIFNIQIGVLTSEENKNKKVKIFEQINGH